ncbi:M23 family metallopeptidase [Paenibacillus thalictri]|uniref:Peptidase M23 n=1 Tax=Paenibacillus thalictri TaxID=2527873 RepID=A0A4Q9DQH2_9BACL|nr:M23 family metallopeptidase [Paenibacillus thalictri]TBL78686.1 peptidase M23 [Paenibacillus thalictri]
MKLTKFHHKLTFVIIPEANQSVYRIKLPRLAAYAIAASIVVLLAAACVVYWVHIKSVVVSQLYRAQNHSRTVQLEQDVASKSKTIEELKNEIFELSQQAAEMKGKVEEIKKLGDHLKSAAPASSAQANPLPVSAAVASSEGGMGGPAFPVTSAQAKELARETKALLTTLGSETRQLHKNLALAQQRELEKQLKLRTTPSIWPTRSKKVTSPFGYRKDPFTAKLSFHRGMDIAGPTGDPVYATAEGVVHTVGFDKFHGNHVVIDHSRGVRTWYMHLSKTAVKTGEPVRKGQSIGQVGSTGRSTGPHLHYEVQLHGKSADPAPYLPK